MGDLNEDGQLDLAVANSAWVGGTSGVSVLVGNGDGTFQSAVNYPAGVQPCSVAIGDLNGDGHPDLAIGNNIGNDVSVLLNAGNGTFYDAVNYGAGVDSNVVVIGDFDGDGYPDLAVPNFEDDTVSVLLGNGDGTFQTAVHYAVGPYPAWLAVGDLNEDGKPDLATANVWHNTVSVLLNTSIDQSNFALFAPENGLQLTTPPTFEWSPGIYDVFLFYSVFPYLGYGYYPVHFWLLDISLPMPSTWWNAIDPGVPCYWAVLGIDTVSKQRKVAGPWTFTKE
jgi:hypothetical protein